MAVEKNRLWPYSMQLALLAVPATWVLFLLLFALSRPFVSSSDLNLNRFLVPLVMAAAFVPLLFLLIDYAAARRATLDIKGIRIDFGRVEIADRAITLPDNIGRPEPAVSDSSPMEIVATLRAATTNRIVRLDLKDGTAWWVTRLLALSAGAVRARSPEVFVFVGLQSGIQQAFLGWTEPSNILRAILQDDRRKGPGNVTYAEVYRRAVRIAKQVAVSSTTVGVPAPPPIPLPPVTAPAPLSADAARYLNNPRYVELGEEVAEQIVMDQLAAYRLEEQPDRLTLSRLDELFEPWLHRESIDLEWPKDRQLQGFVDSNLPYIAVTHRRQYDGLAERAEVNGLILRQLVADRDSGQ